MGVAGQLVQTVGINALPPEVQSAIREKVERFSDFDEEQRPPRRTRFRGVRHQRRRENLLEDRLLRGRIVRVGFRRPVRRRALLSGPHDHAGRGVLSHDSETSGQGKLHHTADANREFQVKRKARSYNVRFVGGQMADSGASASPGSVLFFRSTKAYVIGERLLLHFFEMLDHCH
jgi:hypothetical protein